MYAVVETSGRQYPIQEGRYVDIDLLDNELDSNITLDKVVAIIAGEHSQIGQPYIEGASVQAKVLKHGKAKKVVAFKMRKKKGYRLKKGHRQQFTRILIENIEFPSKEETLNYVKTLEEKVETEQQQEEVKIQEAKEKKLAKKSKQKEVRKQSRLNKVESTNKEEIKHETPEVVEAAPEIVETIPEVVETTPEIVETVPEVVETTPEIVEETNVSSETQEEQNQ